MDNPPMSERRYEIKMAIDDSSLAEVCMWLRLHPQNFSQHYSQRRVNNIYFDSPDLLNVDENLAGLSERRKLRLRWYGNTSYVKQGNGEIKCKERNLGWKITRPMGRCLRLSEMNWQEVLAVLRALAVQERANSQVILRRWKKGQAEYWSVYIAHRESGITQVEDFVGKMVAVEEPHSASGFVLPIGTLVEQGFAAREATGPTAKVAPNEVGYFFARDEENAIELLLQRRVAGAGLSNKDYDKLPTEIKEQLTVFGSTIVVPRQLVSVRAGLDPEVVKGVTQVLSDMDQSERGREVLEGFKETKKFDQLPEGSEQAIFQLKVLMDLVATAD